MKGATGILGMFAAIGVAFVAISVGVGINIVNQNSLDQLSSTEGRMRSVEDVSNDLNFYD